MAPAPNFNPSLLLSHLSKISAAKLDQGDAASATQAAHKAAKAAGINLDALKLLVKIRRMDPLEGGAFMSALINYGKATETAAFVQDDLFRGAAISPIPDSDRRLFMLDQIEIAGRMVGKAGDRTRDDHQYMAGSEEAAAWSRGWKLGDDVRGDDIAKPQKVAAAKGRAGPSLSVVPKGKPKADPVSTEPKRRGRPPKAKAEQPGEFDAATSH